MKRRGLIDPVTGKGYDYITRDEKEEKLYQALTHVLNDDCPPERENYLCMMDETEEQRCEECWLRWATKDFSISKR